jgi:hypothetical protein
VRADRRRRGARRLLPSASFVVGRHGAARGSSARERFLRQRAGRLARRAASVVSHAHGGHSLQRTDRANDARRHAGGRRAVARCDVLVLPPPLDHQCGAVAG